MGKVGCVRRGGDGFAAGVVGFWWCMPLRNCVCRGCLVSKSDRGAV